MGMRIAMFLPGLDPSSLGWHVHRDFAAAVRAAGHDLRVLTTASGASRAAAAAERAAWPDRFEALPEPAGWRRWADVAAPLLRTRSLLPAAGALAGWLGRHGDEIDLLHLEVAYPHAAAAALGAALAGWRGPLAVTPMGEDLMVVRSAGYGFRRYPVPRGLVRWTLRRSAAVRCISPILARLAAEIAPSVPRRTIPLNVSEQVAGGGAIDRREAAAALRREHGLGNRPVILSLGRLHPFKGIDVLVRTLPLLESDACLLVVGPSLEVRPFGDTADGLAELAARLGLRDRVHIVGRIAPERVPEMLAGADVLAVPSHRESLNKVCVEAAAVGTPFVVTRTTGISHFLPEGGVGLTVPPGNPPALAWALDEILGGHFHHDPDAARDFVARFTPRRIAAEVLEFYQDAVA